MFQRISQAAIVTILATGLAMSTYQPAEAGRRGGRIAAGVAAGIVTLGILGAYAHSRDRHRYYEPACYRGPRRCRWVGRRCWHDRYGDYVCRRGYRKCWRPTYCD